MVTALGTSTRRHAMQSFARISVMLITSALIAGCGETAKIYEGDQPRDKVATLMLSPSLDLSSEPAKIREIDGVAINPMDDRAEILPGKHTVSGEVSYRSSWPTKFSTSFEAEAGHTYEVIGACRSESDCTATVRESGTTS
jgi:hypothetical protein